MAREQDEKEGHTPVLNGAIRAAKKAARPVKITEKQPNIDPKANKKRKVVKKSKSAFDDDSSKRGGKGEGARAGRSDGVGLGGKKKGGSKGGKKGGKR